jgi:hypothetical protein
VRERLIEARAKLERAHDHLDELRGEFRSFLEREPYLLAQEFSAETSQLVWRFEVHEEPPLRWAVLIGDVAHNLRSALEYVMWQLVLANGEEPNEQTQFPIALRETLFRPQGISKDHEAIVRELQPFTAVGTELAHPLYVLRQISNRDKHRVLHTTLAVLGAAGYSIHDTEDIAAIGEYEVTFGTIEPGAEVFRVFVKPSGPNPSARLTGKTQLAIAFDWPEEPGLHEESIEGVFEAIEEFVDEALTRFEES